MRVMRKKERDLKEVGVWRGPRRTSRIVPLWLSDFALSLPRSPGVPPFMHVPLQAAFSSPLGSAERNLSQQKMI